MVPAATWRIAMKLRRFDYLLLALTLFCLVLGVLGIITATDSGTARAAYAGDGLHFVDWMIIAIYAAGTITLGWYVSRKQTTTEEYFIGNGKMNPILIGVSLFATLLSTISYLSVPGEKLGKGPASLIPLIGMPVVYWVVAYCILPIYMKQRVTSAYELLEEKLGVGIRLLGATMFILLRLVWMALLIYLAAQALVVMMGVDKKWVPLIVMVTGFVAVIYTSLGGMQAVVITDLVQAILLFGGALIVIALVSADRGFSWFPTEWNENWDTQPLFSWDLSTRVTVFVGFLNMFVWYICTAAGDQTSVQRFMATTDITAARTALKTQLIVSVVISITLTLVGFSLLGYFQHHSLPDGMSLKNDADKIFPYFIGSKLPIGVAGLVVAAMFAAAMSSIDSGVNSITAVVSSDFMDRFGRTPTRTTTMLLAFTIGAIVVVISSAMGSVPGNISAITGRTTNLLVTPIFALFFFALFVPFARPLGVAAGCAVGVTTALLVAFSGNIWGFVTETPFQLDTSTMQQEVKFINRQPTRLTLPDNACSLLSDGETMTLSRPDQVLVLEFDDVTVRPGTAAGNLEVPFTASSSNKDLAVAIINRLKRADPPFHAQYQQDGPLILDVEITPISFLWVGVFSLIANLVVGSLVSLLLPAGRKPSG
jgi:SSS family solute:Na+ symporter